MNKEIVIVDYNCGNLFSVKNALSQFTSNVTISNDKEVIKAASAIVLPGVGAFGEAANHLRDLELIDTLKNQINKGIPFFGICLGMQLLFEKSSEFGEQTGLGILKGSVEKFEFKQDQHIHIPHVGWNTLTFPNKEKLVKSPLRNVENSSVYFVHSFFVVPHTEDVILSNTEYGDKRYCSSIFYENIFATQFHPEKSGKVGLRIFQNWLHDNNLIYNEGI